MIDVPAGHPYLGEHLDPDKRKRNGETGLGVVLVEDALLAGIPTLIIGPKGHLGNLPLTFPELEPDDFAPWVERGKLITWMRRQPGTGQLRVLVYFDEVMGFVPPTAMPPAKTPILTEVPLEKSGTRVAAPSLVRVPVA